MITNRTALLPGLALAAMLGGCFDSLVSDPCMAGYTYQGGQCVASNSSPDAGPGSTADPDGSLSTISFPPDALVCTLPEIDCHGICTDVTSNPDNCGACNRVCASGICQNSHCVGEPYGHIVAIGHDYVAHHPAMMRVLGNAAALATPHDIGVAFYRGTATQASSNATATSLANALSWIGRPSHVIALADSPSLSGVDVFVIDAQTGDGAVAAAAGTQWKPAIDALLARAGVVVVLEGNAGVSYRFAAAAGLYTVAAPVDATNQLALVVDPSDAVADQVVSPYLAETTSVTQPGAPAPAVVATAAGGTIVFHLTR